MDLHRDPAGDTGARPAGRTVRRLRPGRLAGLVPLAALLAAAGCGGGGTGSHGAAAPAAVSGSPAAAALGSSAGTGAAPAATSPGAHLSRHPARGTGHRSAGAAPGAGLGSMAPLPATVATCQPAQLAAHLTRSVAAAGSIGITYALRNVSPVPCRLQGYPGLLLLVAGRPLHTTVVRGSSTTVRARPVTAVLLRPAGTASFDAGYGDVGAGTAGCPVATALEITAPNDYGHLVVPARMAPCGGRVTVSPVYAG